MNQKKRVGIMGGTFDPIHIGHLILGERAYEQFDLDEILFMPSGNPPHKRDRTGRANDKQRVEMVKRAISDNPHFKLDVVEMDDQGYSYTYHTLEKMKQENPDTEYFFIIGADSLFAFDTWKNPERICKACTLIVAVRDHVQSSSLNEKIKEMSERYSGRFLVLDTLNIDVSSNMLRNWIKDKKSPKYYIPETVMEYIMKNNIYADME